jgi:hypothetical protein
MPFLSVTSVDNEALLIKLLDELRAAMKAGNLNTSLAKTFSDKIEETIGAYNLGLHPKGQVVPPETYIKNVISQVERFNEKQLFAGLTLMCKDILNDSSKTKNSDLAVVIDDFFKEEQGLFGVTPLFHEEPVYKMSGASGIPLKKGWYNGEIVSLLNDPAIIHEWTELPGQRLFDKFKVKFKDILCKGEDCIYTKMEKGLLGQADLPATIVSTILTAGISASTFWIPIIVYFALLLIKTGLKTYCEA